MPSLRWRGQPVTLHQSHNAAGVPSDALPHHGHSQQQCPHHHDQQQAPQPPQQHQQPPYGGGELHGAALEAAFCSAQTAAWARQDLWAAPVLGAMYVAVLRRTGVPSPARVLLGFLALVAPALASLGSARLSPGWYARGSHRCWVVGATRLGTALLLTRASELAASGAFADAAATPLQALRKLVGGCRVAPLLLMAVAYPLPLRWLAGVQAAAVARAAAESCAQLCVVPQLTSPAVRDLALRMAGALRWAAGLSPLRTCAGPPPAWLAGSSEAAAKEAVEAVGSEAWSRAAEAMGAGAWCALISVWLQLSLGYVLPLLLRHFLSGRARRDFFRAHCKRRGCRACAGPKGLDTLGAGLTLLALFVHVAITLWELLVTGQVYLEMRQPTAA